MAYGCWILFFVGILQSRPHPTTARFCHQSLMSREYDGRETYQQLLIYTLIDNEPSTNFMVSFSELRNTFLNLDLVKKPLKRHNSEPLLIDSINHHLESASEAAAQKEAIECKVKGNLVGKMNSLGSYHVI